MDPSPSYLKALSSALAKGDATEHTHRPALKTYLEALATGITATNEPRRIACGAPEEVWSFHVGGYQVCEKWLKDRKGRVLDHSDLKHYCRVVAALGDTIRLMAEVDEAIETAGGWPLT
ncbi:MAG TPA: type ISP restriction/modification enzyme [Geothrix sp.]